MSVITPTQTDKCKGAMLATAIGDALGWPTEPRSKNRIKKPKVSDYFVEWTRSCKNPRWHDEKILPGEYSDDTQMVLSVARSIIMGNWEKFLIEKELPFWLCYERGGGSALLSASKFYSENKSQMWHSALAKKYFNAGGNGATMRILPHVIVNAKASDTATLILDVMRNTLITHGHPRAFLGATCYAYALDYLLRKEAVLEYGELVSAVIDGQKSWGAFPNTELFMEWLNAANQVANYDYVNTWETSCEKMINQLEYIKASLKKGLLIDDASVLTQLECFSGANGAGDVAALAAIYLASKYANNPTLGIKVPVFSFGADTDTIASITGGLLGMLSGTSWIPTEWRGVQDYDCLVQITELLLSENKKEATKEISDAKYHENGWKSFPIGKMRLIETTEVPNGQHGVVIIRKWQTTLGQTLYIKEARLFDNKSNEEQPDGQKILNTNTTLDESTAKQILSKQALSDGAMQSSKSIKNNQSQFVINSATITALLNKPEFKQNITVGKVLKVIQALLDTNDTNAKIAIRFNIDETMVELINMCIKDSISNETI